MSHGLPLLGAPRGKFATDQHENIIPSLQVAPAWVDVVYINVRLTSDGVPVLMHDTTVDRTTDGTGAVDSLTLAEIQAFDAGDGAQVPTLAQYLDAVVTREQEADDPVRPLQVILRAHDETESGIETVYNVASAWSLYQQRVEWVFNFHQGDTGGAANLRALDDSTPIGTFGGRVDNIHDLIADVQSVDGQYVFVNPGTTGYSADPAIVDTVRDAGLTARVSRTSDGQVIETVHDDSRVQLLLTFATTEYPDWHTDDPTPEPPPAPPPVARAEVRTRVTWLGCRLVDGRIISEIPDTTGQVSRVLGDVTTAGLTLPIPISGPGALPIGLVEQLTEPGRAMIAAVVNDIPTWAGIVGASEGGTDGEMSVPVASLEAYLDRRVVRTHELEQVDEAEIAATLVGDAGDIPGVGSGIGLTVDAPPTGTLRDRQYLVTDRKTVLEALQELMGVIDGPEWTIDLDWTDDTHTAVAKIFRVRKRIGVASGSPDAVFQARAHSVFGSQSGSEARYRFKVDYTNGRGANYIVAYSSGQEEDQPASVPAIAQDVLDAGYPIYERHFQPSSNITSQPVLNDHAAAELDRRRRGTRTWTLEARWDAFPRYGVDWQLGDDIAWDLIGHRHPQGIRGKGRAIGFTLDMQAGVIRPILEEQS